MKRWKVAKFRVGFRCWLEHCDKSRKQEEAESRQDQVCRRILLRIVNRTLTAMFDRWTEKLYEKRRLQKLMLRFKNSRLYGWFNTWRDQISMLKCQRNLVKRAMVRVANSLMFRCFDNWCDDVETRKRLRNRMLVSMKRWKVAKLQSGISQWKTFIVGSRVEDQDQDRVHKAARRVLSRMIHRRISMLFDRWLDFIERKRGMRRIVYRWLNAQKNRSFNTWCDNVRERKRNRQLLARFLSRAKNAQLARCLRRWEESTTIRIRLRTRMILTLQRWSIAQLQWGMKKWHLFIIHHQLHSKSEKKKKRIARKMISRMLHRKLALRFDMWVELVKTKKKLQHMIKRLMNRKLSISMETWRLHVEESMHHRRIAKKIITKMTNLKIVRCLSKWCDWCDTRITLRRRMKVAVKRWITSRLATGLYRWRVHLRLMREHELLLQARLTSTKKMMARSLHRHIAHSFYQWQDFLTAQRRLVRFMLRLKNAKLYRWFQAWSISLKEDRRQHMLVLRCLKRVRLSCVARCWSSWTEMIEKRTWLRKTICTRVQRWSEQELCIGWKEWCLHTRRHQVEENRRERETQVARKILGRIIYRGKVFFFERWKATMDEKKRLVRFMLRIKHQHAYWSLKRWRDGVYVSREQRRRVQRCLSRGIQATMHRCFDCWSTTTNNRKFVRKRMILAMRRWTTAKVRNGYTKWQQFTIHVNVLHREKEEKTKRAKQLLARIMHRDTFQMFRKWNEMLAEKRRLRRFLLRMKNLAIHQTFISWRSSANEQKVQRGKVEKSLRRALNGHLHRCMQRWIDMVDERVSLRHRMTVTMKRWSTLMRSFGFTRWKKWLEEEKRKEHVRERRKLSAQRLLLRMYHRDKFLVMCTWKEMLRSRQRLKKFLLRINHSRYYGWFLRWKRSVHSMKEKRLKILSTLYQSDQMCLMEKFKQWSEWSDCRDRVRKRMLIAVQRWKVACMASGLYQWRVWSIKRKRELERKEKILSTRAEQMERCLHGSMVCHLRKHWLRFGFNKLRQHVHTTTVSNTKALHSKQMSSMASTVEKKLNGIRTSIKKFRYRALVFCLSRSLGLVGRMSVQRAFQKWTIRTMTERNDKDLLITTKLLYLERVVGRKRRNNVVSGGRALRKWRDVTCYNRDVGKLLIACARLSTVRSLERARSLKRSFLTWSNVYLKIQRSERCQAEKKRRVFTLRHLGRLLLGCEKSWLIQKVGILFRKWSNLVVVERDHEWRDRLDRMRSVVFEHTKDSEHHLVGVVRKRLEMWERKREEEDRKNDQ